MLTNEEKKMLRVVAAYNDTTEEMAKQLIVKRFLDNLSENQDSQICDMKLPDPPREKKEAEIKEPKKRGGRPRKTKTLSEFVQDTAEEVEQAEREGKMSKEEFIDYFSKKGANKQ